MLFIKFTTDKSVKRLRWLIACVIFVDAAVTLLGQSGTYWRNPQTALEGDPFFYQYLSRGYLPFCLAMLVYVTFAFSVVSIMPRRVALVLIFAYIFAHYFGAESWLMLRWKPGGVGLLIYSILLGAAVVVFAFPAPCLDNRSQTPPNQSRGCVKTF
jgi:hypothetical protein